MEKICCTCHLLKNDFYKNKLTVDGFSVQCKSCAKNYRDAHKENKKNYPSSSSEYRKKYIKENKESINESTRKRRQKDVEKFRREARERYVDKKDIINEYHKKYYKNNKSKVNAKQKEYRNKNIDSILLRNRARKLKIDKYPKITQMEISKLLTKLENKCYYCGINVSRGINLHLDHKIPLSRGGEHNIQNIVPSCNVCNLRKGTKTSEEFFN